ncbi:MAG TPA: hypothetical protein VJ417_12495 [Candidatus Glassbacteria bacterium]|nr:hypothetical protein [Candidatus Glassbacteria bacterium]
MKATSRDRLLSLVMAALSAILLRTGIIRACEDMTVRDAAFGYRRDVHILSVMAQPGDPKAEMIYSRLEKWIATFQGKFNLQLDFVDAVDPAVAWQNYGIPSAPPSLPVVVLTGRPSPAAGRSIFVVDHWEPGPAESDLEVLRSSPARERIREVAGQRLALLVYVPGTDGGSSAAREVVQGVASRWTKQFPLGVEVLEVNRSDQGERLLLSFMGVARQGPNWAAVVFGRGKLMPPLQGEEITEAALDGQLKTLTGNCSCLQNPTALGVDLPLAWDASLDSTVTAFAGPGGALVHSANVLGVLGPAMWAIVGLVLLAGLATVVVLRKGNGES